MQLLGHLGVVETYPLWQNVIFSCHGSCILLAIMAVVYMVIVAVICSWPSWQYYPLGHHGSSVHMVIVAVICSWLSWQ
jgi:hypothetical protein